MKPRLLHKVLSALLRVWRFIKRLLIWHTLHQTYCDCFEWQIPCPIDAGGTERKRWQTAGRIEELQWLSSRPKPKVS